MPTLAERLGFAPTDRIAVVHADDIGMCHAANEGAFDALANGVVSCGSIMVPCPWFRDAAERARSHPALDLGVQRIEDVAMDRALNGVEVPVYHFGAVVGTRRVYNDRLLMFMLRIRAPKRFAADSWQSADAATVAVDVTALPEPLEL